MAQINMTRELTAIGVGVADEALEWVDRNQGNTKPFTSLTDWGRVGGAVAGGFMVMQNMARDIGEPLLYSSTTLAVKSVARLVREGMGISGQVQARRAAAHQAALMAGTLARTPAEVEEFEGIRLGSRHAFRLA